MRLDLNTRRAVWIPSALLGFAMAAGCAADPVDPPALSEQQIASAEVALDDALAAFEDREGVTVSQQQRDGVVAALRDILVSLRHSDVEAAQAALEHEGMEDDLGDFSDEVTDLGGGPSTSGSFELDGADEGSFDTGGTDTGTFEGGAGTGGSFDGPEGAQSGSFGTQYFPCRSHGTVTAFSFWDIEASIFRGIDCVAANSNPTLRWDNLPGGGPYDLVTFTFDLQTALTLMDDPEMGLDPFFAGFWGPIRTGATSITYQGPRLRARGGLGFLVGVVFGPGSEGVLVAFVF